MTKPDLSAADQCVMCGMCHPYCPTYQASKIETESPRGRLSMIQGLANGTLKADASVIRHLDNCTRCGACEAMCPSRVPFIELMDNSKQLLSAQFRPPFILRTLLWLTAQPTRYGIIRRLFKNHFLGNLLRKTGLMHSDTLYLQQALPRKATALLRSTVYQAKGSVKGNVGLFTGCITQIFDANTLQDTITLLTNCGYNVHLPKSQVCCGALHQHNGQTDIAEQLSRQNQDVFQSHTLDAVISTATGCGSQLQTQLTGIVVLDILQFIHENQLLDQLQFQPLSQTALLHIPCSQRKTLKQASWLPVLKQLPALLIEELVDNQRCCGAGGSNLLLMTESASLLRVPKLNHIKQATPDLLLSSNYGCALHLAAGLKKPDNLSQDKLPEILHPVSLLVRSASLQ